MCDQRHSTRHLGDARAIPLDPMNLPSRPTYAEQRADRAEFLLAIMAQCVGSRFAQIHMYLWPGPVERDGVTLDGSDRVKAVRHDMIRKLFHS